MSDCVLCGRELGEGRAMVCQPCRPHLRQTLTDIHRLWTRLPEALQPPRGGGQKVSGSRTPPVPINLDSVDLAGLARPGSRTPYVRGILGLDEDQTGHLAAATTLHRIAQEWRLHRNRSEQAPPADVPELIDWLDVRLGDACDTYPDIADNVTEFKDLKAALRATVGDFPPRPQRCDGIPCRKCDLRALYRTEPWITCGNCGQLYSHSEYHEWTRLLAADTMRNAA